MNKYEGDSIEHYKAREVSKKIADIVIFLFFIFAVFEAGIVWGLFR